jgi:S-adenosylmethionine:tRNA ribosyltransferase-isomerase
MIPANAPEQRPFWGRLLVAGRDGRIEHWRRRDFVQLFREGDLVIANDAATLPASLSGRHAPSGREIEVRLAGRDSLDQVTRFTAVLFGSGDFRTPTENRSLPPAVRPGDRLLLGPLCARVIGLHHHPRLIALELEGSPAAIWEGLAHHGRPIQYSHLRSPLALWDIWSPIAGPPVAFEPPSAGFVLDWDALDRLNRRGARFATITHAAGISSTGDTALDALLPLDEPYRIPASTARAIREARKRGGRIIAIGTTVVRALEHAALGDQVVRAGEAVASQRIDASSRLAIVNAILSGTHEPGTSHHDLLRAFAGERMLGGVDLALNQYGYRTHEFGDSVFLEDAAAVPSMPPAAAVEVASTRSIVAKCPRASP